MTDEIPISTIHHNCNLSQGTPSKAATTETVLRAVRLGTATLGITDGVIQPDLDAQGFSKERFGLYYSVSRNFAGRTDSADKGLRTELFVNFKSETPEHEQDAVDVWSHGM